MRILCCLDGTNAKLVSHAAQIFSTAEPLTIALLTVIDVGPRRDIDRTREQFWRSLRHEPITEEMQAAEKAVSEDILKAGLGNFSQAAALLRQGRPELEIVNAAAEWRADVILICPRAEMGSRHILVRDRSGTLRALFWIMRPARCCCCGHWLSNNFRSAANKTHSGWVFQPEHLLLRRGSCGPHDFCPASDQTRRD